ncbi:hypothetical protein G4B88_001097 [Cannabis sativa]|uniref:Uncharacterized protein n=1 Tax=Cannabis sativa TaxID=3483 RepID=A0A7J6E0N0_CANSA|nr:hypothetical protein G4B88_001097 [Cannabis sativa]
MALHLQLSVHRLVNEHLERELVNQIMGSNENGLVRMLEESPSVASKLCKVKIYFQYTRLEHQLQVESGSGSRFGSRVLVPVLGQGHESRVSSLGLSPNSSSGLGLGPRFWSRFGFGSESGSGSRSRS